MDCCADDNEPLGFVKGVEFLEQLIDCFRQFCAPLCCVCARVHACKVLLFSIIAFLFQSYQGFVKGRYSSWQVTSLFTEHIST
jgi:hypothetical protein